jgi:dTDP-4-amino-4,6-dideoxygalactose transaminase
MTFPEHLAALGAAWHLYANASNAFKDFLGAAVSAAAKRAPNVVMPSYLPAKLLRAVLAAGCAVRFYEVHGACRFDLPDVERQVDADTVAIFHVHYFGFPGDVEGLRALATRRGVALVEDCALTLGGRHRGRPLGTFGDAALFSMRKMLLYPEGGALVVSERWRNFRPAWERRVSSFFSAPRWAAQRAKYGYVRLTRGADPLRLVRAAPVGHMDGNPVQTLSVKAPSRFTTLRLAFTDVERLVALRRANYRWILERFPDSPALAPVYPELPGGTTPYSFPLLVREGDRDTLRRALVRDGILGGAGWPESPFDPSLGRTQALSATLVELPVHQALTRAQLERSIRCVESVTRKPRTRVGSIRIALSPGTSRGRGEGEGGGAKDGAT